MKLEFTGLNTNKFHDELIAAGINATSIIVTSNEDKTWVDIIEDIPDADTTIMAVVAAHDPSPRPEGLSELESLQKELFETQTALLNADQTIQELGQAHFSLETQLVMKGVL